MIFPLIGLVVGIIVGIQGQWIFPQGYTSFAAMGILACVDSVLGGIRAKMTDEFCMNIFLSGFICNSFLAIAFVWVGSKLNLQLSLAVILVFGGRIFQNLALIRRSLLKKESL